MSLRRVFALVVLALDAYFVLRVAPGMGMIGPVFQLIGILVGIGALGVVLFNLPFVQRDRADPRDRRRGANSSDDDDPTHPAADAVGGLLAVLLFVIAPLTVAVRGVYLGVLPPFFRPRSPDISFAQTPGLFVFNLLIYVACGSVFLFLILRGRAKSKSQARIGAASRKV